MKASRFALPLVMALALTAGSVAQGAAAQADVLGVDDPAAVDAVFLPQACIDAVDVVALYKAGQLRLEHGVEKGNGCNIHDGGRTASAGLLHQCGHDAAGL